MQTYRSLGALLCALFFATVLSAFGQGSLTPPGAPAPTMKTLDEVEPRRLIKVLPFTIGSSGSYYLTGSLTGVSGNHGITVNAHNVRIDLNGFELIGAAGSSTSGVFIGGGITNVAIRNGTIRNWTSHGVNGAGNHDVRVENVIARNNGGNGLLLDEKALVLNCLAEGNVNIGIYVLKNSIVKNSQAIATTGSPGNGFQLATNCAMSDCTAGANFGNGIVMGAGGALYGCASSSNTLDGFNLSDGSSIASSIAYQNGINGGATPNSSGIRVSFNCTVSNCVANGNTGSGLTVSSGSFNNGPNVTNSVFNGNTLDGITASAGGANIQGCIANDNGGDGIIVSAATSIANSIINCTVKDNTGDGIQCGSGRVAGNLCSANGSGAGDGAGIHILAGSGGSCLIEGNNVVSNDRGIHVESAFNFIVRNVARANTTAYDIVANNKVGVIVAAPNSLAIIGSTGGAGVGSTDPWSNFSY